MEREPEILIYSGISDIEKLAKRLEVGYIEKGVSVDLDRFKGMISEGTRVVIIDDEPMTLRSDKTRVELLGGVFYGFEDVEEALRELPSLNPDIVLVDYYIRGSNLDGEKLIGKVKSLFHSPLADN